MTSIWASRQKTSPKNTSSSREQQDAFAAASQQKAIEAIAAGRFVAEITPVSIPQRKGDPLIFDTDEQPRAGTTATITGQTAPRL